MNTYVDSKKALDKIREDFGCKGDIIFRTAIQYIVEYGQQTFQDYDFVMNQMAEIDGKHDKAEADGKTLFVSRDFEKAIIECAEALSKINTYDLIIYMQKEMYWSNEGGIDYGRLKQIITRTMYWIVCDSSDSSEDYDTFSNECNIEDDEIEELGFGYLIPEEEQ